PSAAGVIVNYYRRRLRAIYLRTARRGQSEAVSFCCINLAAMLKNVRHSRSPAYNSGSSGHVSLSTYTAMKIESKTIAASDNFIVESRRSCRSLFIDQPRQAKLAFFFTANL
ncbi:hypothetical protein, partial [Escherichia coli]|uniref:hypothetical protein n=1 Tax=Escherichia coli TaxID=562 RepID=UPI001A8E9A56